MDRAVAAAGPAGALLHVGAMRHLANEYFTRSPRTLHLGVAFEAKVLVALDEHLPVDRTMRTMADNAAFTERLVLKDEWPRLFAMALGAVLVELGHGESARWLENVTAMRVVTLPAVHPPLED